MARWRLSAMPTLRRSIAQYAAGVKVVWLRSRRGSLSSSRRATGLIRLRAGPLLRCVPGREVTACALLASDRLSGGCADLHHCGRPGAPLGGFGAELIALGAS